MARRRVNISISPLTYERLRRMQRRTGFASICGMMASMANIMADYLEGGTIDEDDDEYIGIMFQRMEDAARKPYGNVPKRHNKKSIEKI